jgi:hypothetical protein
MAGNERIGGRGGTREGHAGGSQMKLPEFGVCERQAIPHLKGEGCNDWRPVDYEARKELGLTHRCYRKGKPSPGWGGARKNAGRCPKFQVLCNTKLELNGQISSFV